MPRRLAITGPRLIEVIDYTDRPLEANEVLVRTQIASGKHGTFTAMLDNQNFRGQSFDQEMRMFVPAPDALPNLPTREKPWATGTTGVGMVEKVGAGVTRWKVGDRVFGLMDVRQTNIVREDKLWLLGEIAPDQALLIEPAYVAFHSIRESNVRIGDKVAIIGLGAIGLLAVRLALAAGAEQVFAVDTLPIRREWATQHGATHVLDPLACDVALEIHKLSGGKGVDVAIEVAGNYTALETAIRSTRMLGTVCATGFYQGEARNVWFGREWHHNRLTMIVPHGCGWGHPPRDYPRWDDARAYDAIVSLIRQGTLVAPGLIHPVVTLNEGPAVWELIQHNPGQVIKYAVKFE